jgi:multidrug transporter EmrE-like cation transporter
MRLSEVMTFFQRHVLPGIGLLLGPAIALGSLILHAHALTEIGLPVEYWVAIGLGIFFLSVVGILIKWEQENLSLPTSVPTNVVNPLVTNFPPVTKVIDFSPVTKVTDSRPSAVSLVPPPVNQPMDRIFVSRDPKDLMQTLEGKMRNEQNR